MAVVEDYDTYEPSFRRHYATTYADTEYGYEDYESGYRYGYDLATEPQYEGRTWGEVEPEARRGWEEEAEGAWEDFKDAVQHGWNEVKRALS
jgi:predicted glutamine amidotransferase